MQQTEAFVAMWHGRSPNEREAPRATPIRLVPEPAPRLAFDLVPGDAMAAAETAWIDLAGRALEPNPFFEADFALPALHHLYDVRKPDFALVWHTDGVGRRLALAALLPIQPHYLLGFARVAVHRFAPLGTPLIDRANAGVILDHLLSGIRASLPRVNGVIFPELPVDGPVGAALRARAVAAGEPLNLLSEYERAALDGTHAATCELPCSAKRRKNLRRQRRRLGDAGPLTYRSATGATAVREATDAFLELEARGWKGRTRTALLHEPGAAAFTRAMTERLAAAGRCRIDSLEVGGRAIAMGIVIGSADRAYFWKTAYDEAVAGASPGVQLALDISRTQLARPGLTLTDSCAVEDHPMINGIWPDRVKIADVFVPLQRGGRLALRAEHLARASRALAKRLIAAPRRRRDA